MTQTRWGSKNRPAQRTGFWSRQASMTPPRGWFRHSYLDSAEDCHNFFELHKAHGAFGTVDHFHCEECGLEFQAQVEHNRTFYCDIC